MLRYSGGPYRKDLYTGVTTRQALLTDINTTLVAANWTSQNVYAFNQLYWTGQPSNGQTITISGQTYTFNTVLGAANSILIGATAQATYFNLYSAVNLLAGIGTLYGLGTTINNFITAADIRNTSTSQGVMRLQVKTNPTPFGLQSTQTTTKTTSNSTLAFTTNDLAGYIWTSPATPSGQQVRIYGIDALESAFTIGAVIRLYIMDESELYRSTDFTIASNPNNPDLGFRLTPGSYSSWQIVASPYQVAIYASGVGAPTGNGSTFFAAVPYIYSFLQPYQINGATNTSPIEITTTAPHGYSTADNVIVRGVGGNTAANGIFAVTVTSATKFTIPVAGNGAYTAGGYTSKLASDRTAMAFFGSNDAGTANCFPFSSLTIGNSYGYMNLNGSGTYLSQADGIGAASVVCSVPARIQDGTDPLVFTNGQTVIDEPHLVIGTGISSKALWCGQLYDTFTSLKQNTLAQAATVDSRNWIALGGTAGSTTRQEGSLFMVTP